MKTKRKRLLDFGITVLLMYAGITAFLYFYQRNLLYFPAGPKPLIQFKAEPEIIKVQPQTGIELEGWYWPPKDNKPTIIFFHGNGQAYQYWANKMAEYYTEGYGAFFTDYRGYGGTNGDLSEQGVYQDARSFINALKRKAPNAGLIFYGESLGTGVAVQMATEFAPKALILESAYSATSDVAKGRYWMFPVDLLMKDQYRSIDKIGNLKMPKFFIHAKSDQVVPIKYGQKLYDAAPEPKTFKAIEKAGHNSLYDYGAQLHILDFLRTLEKE